MIAILALNLEYNGSFLFKKKNYFHLFWAIYIFFAFRFLSFHLPLYSNKWIKIRSDHFQFGSVFIYKNNNQIEIFFLKKPKPVQIDRFWFRFRFFRTKTGSNRFGSILAQFFRLARFWLGFFGFTRFWLGFFRFRSIRFGFSVSDL